jgi:hypothetical protein
MFSWLKRKLQNLEHDAEKSVVPRNDTMRSNHNPERLFGVGQCPNDTRVLWIDDVY